MNTKKVKEIVSKLKARGFKITEASFQKHLEKKFSDDKKLKEAVRDILLNPDKEEAKKEPEKKTEKKPVSKTKKPENKTAPLSGEEYTSAFYIDLPIRKAEASFCENKKNEWNVTLSGKNIHVDFSCDEGQKEAIRTGKKIRVKIEVIPA